MSVPMLIGNGKGRSLVAAMGVRAPSYDVWMMDLCGVE